MRKKFPNYAQINFTQQETVNKSLPVSIKEGDFFIPSDIFITSNIFVPQGVYTAKNHHAVFPVTNLENKSTILHFDSEVPIAEIYNFEEINHIPLETSSSNPVINEIRASHLNQEEKTKLFTAIQEYEDVFYRDGTDLSFSNVIKHNIETKDEFPVYTKSYRYPFIHKQEVEKQISDMLTKGIIRPSTSPWCSPIWIVPKKIDASGKQKWRLVVDYRKLNEKTVDDKYPLPNITDILDKLGRCQYFTTLDLTSGFHQIEVHPKDVPKTAFSVEHGLYEFIRMPFGLKNAPATFQRVMDHVLRNLIGKCCLVYMDDIIIFSTSLQEHVENLKKVFAALRKANLKIQLDKSEFLKKEVEFLGHIVTDQGVKPNPNKIDAIKRWPLPKNQKELKGFLGILGYYRRFIRDFAKITKPLTAQLRKGEVVEQTSLFVKTFEKCKELLTQSNILQYPDMEQPFILTTDASNFVLGAVLSQGPVGKDKPVAFASRTLTKTEEKYSAIEKELLAIVWATQYFRPYLFGRKFTLYTDHQPLTYALNLKTPNTRLVKWRLRLLEYDFEIIHRPGKQNVVADALSRIPENPILSEPNTSRPLEVDTTVELNINEEELSNDDSSVHSAESDSSNLIGFTEKPINVFHNQIILKIGTDESEEYEEVFPKMYRRTITKFHFGVPFLIRLFREYMSPGKVNCILCPESLFQSLQVVYKNYFSRCKVFKVIISQKILIDLKTAEQQNVIIADTHETAHRGIVENKEEIFRRFYFPNLKKRVRAYILLCKVCNRQKYERHPYKIELSATPIPKRPLDIIHVDVFIVQPNIFLSVVDKLSRFGILLPIKSRCISDIRKALLKYFVMYGRPKMIVSDNEPALKSIEVRGLLFDLHIQQYFTPSNYSQVNGIVERFHSTISEIFRTNRHKYEDLSAKEMFFIACTLYNNTIHSATKLKPREVFQPSCIDEPLNIDAIIAARDKIYTETTFQLAKTQRQQNDYHNISREEPPILDPQQSVLNRTQGIKSKTRDQFEEVRVDTDRNQTYTDTRNRKLHKSKLKRIRK